MSANTVVDPAQLERLREAIERRLLHSCCNKLDWWCDGCLAVIYAAIAAAIEEQTIERCAAEVADTWIKGPWAADRQSLATRLRSLPRQWSSTPEEAR